MVTHIHICYHIGRVYVVHHNLIGFEQDINECDIEIQYVMYVDPFDYTVSG